jgi:drug/metabolite transporter (DMT)-like permease
MVKDFSFTSIDLLITLGLSMISVMSAVSITYVIKKVDISESSALLAMTPIFVAICGFIILNEKITSMQLAGIALSSVGLFILEKKHGGKNQVIKMEAHTSDKTTEKQISDFHITGNIVGETNSARILDNHTLNPDKISLKKPDIKLYAVLIFSLIFFALSTIGDRHMIHYRNIDPILFLIIVQICISINFIVYDIGYARKHNTKNSFIDHKLFREKYFWLNSLLIICHRITHMYGVNLIEASIFNAVKQVNAIFTTIIGGKLFQEKELLRKTFACIIIVLGILLITFYE